jgi:cation:H+ antiporter
MIINALMTISIAVFFILGLVLLIGGAEIMVRGASRLAAAVGVSPLVIGLTVVAFGTSAPELAVSIQAGFIGQADLAVGNVIGSNIANILLILGTAALFAPLIVNPQLVRLDLPLVIAASFAMYFLGRDGRLTQLECFFLFLGILAYVIYSIWQSRRQHKSADPEIEGLIGDARHYSWRYLSLNISMVVVGLILLVVGADWLVDSAVKFAQFLGISELVIGLTVVAFGTSAPELATSVVAVIRGERDIAVGNVIGSNLFNILSVLGLAGAVTAGGLAVSTQAINFDIPFMTAVAIICLPLFYKNYRISRWEGAIFLGYYIAYTVYLGLDATNHAALPWFITIMQWTTVVTLVGLGAAVVRARRQFPP